MLVLLQEILAHHPCQSLRFPFRKGTTGALVNVCGLREQDPEYPTEMCDSLKEGFEESTQVLCLWQSPLCFAAKSLQRLF